MRRGLRAPIAVVAAMTALLVAPISASGATQQPLWVKHVQQYPGGISNGVRASLDPGAVSAQSQFGPGTAETAAITTSTQNVQMNTDSNPPLPQNETSVAYSLDNPLIAVAGSNDYVSEGTLVMRTSDGGKHWQSTPVIPVFRPFSEVCNGGDPSLAYSARDHAFYLGQLCFFRTESQSEVQIYKSLDNGQTWTPGRRASIAATNYDATTGTVDGSVFNDKEYITVDNNPGSAHYGRLYVTWTRFHFAPDGSSDTCPIKLAYTDRVPTSDPSTTKWQHSDVVPDNPSDQGVGESSDQFSDPVVESNGTLDIAYVIEECNTSLDHGLRFQKSTNGGKTFLASPVVVDKPGLWKDNPNTADIIPNTAFRTPNTVAIAYSQTTGTLEFIYTNYIRGRANGDIEASRSTDGGLTWSDPIPVSVTAGGQPAPKNQFFPWIATDPSGRFHAMWLDRRLDPNNHDINTFQGLSSDDGATWTNTLISTKSWNPDQGFFSSGAFIGDYSGIAANDQAVYPVWTDGRNTAFARTGIGETDIFTNVEIAS